MKKKTVRTSQWLPIDKGLLENHRIERKSSPSLSATFYSLELPGSVFDAVQRLCVQSSTRMPRYIRRLRRSF